MSDRRDDDVLDLEIDLELNPSEEEMELDLELDLETDSEENEEEPDFDFDMELTSVRSIDVDKFLSDGEFPEETGIDLDIVLGTEESDTDLKLSEMLASLVKEGFIANDSMPLEQVEYLYSRLETSSTPLWNASELYKFLEDRLFSVLQVVRNVTEEASSNSNNILTELNNITKEQENSNELYKDIIASLNLVISSVASNGKLQKPTPELVKNLNEDIEKKLLSRSPHLNNEMDRLSISRIMMELTPKVLNQYYKYQKKLTDQELYVNRLSKHQLGVENEDLAILKDCIDQGCSTIKQMKYDSNTKVFTLNCSSCQSDIVVKGIIMKSLFYIENKRYINYFPTPVPITCSCGHHHVFYIHDYKECIDQIASETKSSLMMFCENANNFSKGTGLLRSNISVYTLLKTSPNLFIVSKSTETNDLLEAEKVSKKKPMDIKPVDTLDFDNAVSRFYTGLKRYKFDSKVGDKVRSFKPVFTLSSVAYYVSTMLGKEYVKYKEQALISLMLSFIENHYFNKYLNMTQYWSLKSYYKLCDSSYTSKVVNLTKETKDKLVTWYGEFTGEYIGNEEDKEIIKKVTSCKKEIKRKIKDIDSGRKKAIAVIKDFQFELGTTPVINTSTFSLKMFDAFMWSEELNEIMDIISDRMIISDLSYNFFNIWKTYEVISRAAINSALIVTSDPGSSESTLEAAFNKTNKIKEVDPDSYIPRLRLAVRHTVYDLGPLFDVYRSIKACDYYSALEKCRNIIDTEKMNKMNLVLSKDYSIRINNLIEKWSNKFDEINHMTIAEYNLKDFSKEEIEEYIEKVNTIDFGRYTLKRLPNENIDMYLERLKVATEKGTIDAGNSYDNISNLDAIMEDIGMFSAFLTIYTANYSNYTETMFMIKTLEYITVLPNFNAVAILLGVSIDILKTYIMQYYDLVPQQRDVLNSEFRHILSNLVVNSSIDNMVMEWAKYYKEEFINVGENTEAKRDKYNPILFLSSIIHRPEKEFINPLSTVELEPDKSESIEELLTYFGEYEEIEDLLRGEL